MPVRYMAWRPWDRYEVILRIHDTGRQEQWTPDGWVPNASMQWTGIGGDSDWDELTEAEAEAVIEEFESDASAKANETLYTVSHEGEVLGTGLTADEVYNYVLDNQSHSYYYATKVGGWKVKPEDGRENETLYTVSHEGEVLGTGLTADEVYNYVLDNQSHSYYYATKHGGWKVNPEVSSMQMPRLMR